MQWAGSPGPGEGGRLSGTRGRAQGQDAQLTPGPEGALSCTTDMCVCKLASSMVVVTLQTPHQRALDGPYPAPLYVYWFSKSQ